MLIPGDRAAELDAALDEALDEFVEFVMGKNLRDSKSTATVASSIMFSMSLGMGAAQFKDVVRRKLLGNLNDSLTKKK